MDCLDALIMLIGVPSMLWVGTIYLKDTAETLEEWHKTRDEK